MLIVFRLRVKEVLDEKKVTLGKMQRGADIPFSMARRLIKDPNYIPSIPTLEKVARYLGVSIQDLYEYNEDLPSHEKTSPDVAE